MVEALQSMDKDLLAHHSTFGKSGQDTRMYHQLRVSLPVPSGVLYASHNAGCVGMIKAVLMALLLSVGLSAPAAAVKQYQRYGDPRPGGVWNDGPFACLPGRSCNCHPDTYVAIRCERTPDGPQCWWNSNCYCEPPIGSQYCGSRSGDWPAFRKRPKSSMRLY